MLYGPDILSSDEEGLSDDNDYYEFKQRLKNKRQNEIRQSNEVHSKADLEKKRLNSVLSAISYGRDEVVIDELNKGLQIDTDLENGWTPLLLSSAVANNRLLSKLLTRGASINQTRDGCTPLMLACNRASEDEVDKNNVTACVKLLLEYGADFSAIDHKRKTALMFAAYNGHLEAVKLLLPLSNKEAEDNQRWTALFWAVEGNNVEVVDLLLKEGCSCDKVDVRGNTVVDIALSNGFEEILELLPKNTSGEDVYTYLQSNNLNFENTFKDLKKEEKPQLFSDICKILYGSRSESLVQILCDQNITLLDFLSANESKLEQLGIKLPYQRKRILGGLFKFHKHPFQPKSITFVRKGEIYTNIDVSSAVVTCIRQLIAMEASLKFVMENFEDKLDPLECREIEILVAKNRHQVNRLKNVARQFVKQTEMWDSMLKPADRITKKRRNIPWCNICLTVSILTALGAVIYKIK